MNSKRVFFLMCALVGLLVVGSVAAVVGGDQLLHKKAAQLMSSKLDNKVLDEQQTSLVQAKKDIVKYTDLENIAKSVVPQDKDQAEAVREIVKIAGDNGIVLSSISFPSSTLGQTAAPAATASGNQSAASTAPISGTAPPPITQVQAVSGIPGVYSLQINIQQDTNQPVSYDRFISFLGDLEQNRRTSQVSTINVTPNSSDRSKLTFSLTLQAYIKP